MHASGVGRDDGLHRDQDLDQRLRLRRDAARLRQERRQARRRPDRPADPAPGAAVRLRQDARGLPGAGEAARGRQGPRHRRQQLHGRAPRPTCSTRPTVVPAVNQIELHPYFQQPEVQAFDAEHGILTQAWSPIGGITFYREGEHTSTLDDPDHRRDRRAHGKSPAQVMLRWHLQEGRSVIPKSTKPRPHRRELRRLRLRAHHRRARRDRRARHRQARRSRAGRHHPGKLRPGHPGGLTTMTSNAHRTRSPSSPAHRPASARPPPAPWQQTATASPCWPAGSTASPLSRTNWATGPPPSKRTSPIATASLPPPTASAKSSAPPVP